MGFPAGSVCSAPLALVKLAFALENIIDAILSWVGVSPPSHLQTSSSLQYESQISPAFAFGEIIRENLRVVTFASIAGKLREMEEDVIECAVCLSAFEEEDEIRELSNCCHVFHRDCLDKWVDHRQKTCPLCRYPLLPKRECEAGNGDDVGDWTRFDSLMDSL